MLVCKTTFHDKTAKTNLPRLNLDLFIPSISIIPFSFQTEKLSIGVQSLNN